MAPDQTVTPAEGHINNVYGRLLLILDISETVRYQEEAEDVRELRFILRKFVHELIQLTASGSGAKEEYLQAASAAAAHQTGRQNAESIATRAADALREILEETAWDLEDGLTPERQKINSCLKGIKGGIKAAVESLSEVLKEEGTEDIEYDEQTYVPVELDTPRKTRPHTSAASTPSRSRAGQGNFRHGKSRKWTEEENLEMLRILARDPKGTNTQSTADFNQRMAAKSASKGIQPENPRTSVAWRLQAEKLKKAGTTIADLEAALGGDGDVEENG